MPSPRRRAVCQKDRISTEARRRRTAATTIELADREGFHDETMRHLANPIAKSFSEALRIDKRVGSWIFVSGHVGVAIHRTTSRSASSRKCAPPLNRIREPLRKLDADMDKIASI